MVGVLTLNVVLSTLRNQVEYSESCPDFSAYQKVIYWNALPRGYSRLVRGSP